MQKCNFAVTVVLDLLNVVTPNVTAGLAVSHLERVRQSAKRRVASQQSDLADATRQPPDAARDAEDVDDDVAGRQKL